MTFRYRKDQNLLDILNSKKINNKLLLLFIFMLWKNSYGDTIILRDKSQLMGQIISSNADVISLTNSSLGRIDVAKHNILAIKKKQTIDNHKTRVKGTIFWDNKLQVGLLYSQGNSKLFNFNGNININRNRLWKDEWTFYSDFKYSTDQGEITTEKLDISFRYAFSIKKAFYNFYRIGFLHHYTADLNIKIFPTVGFGYWLFDSSELKLMGELGGGYSKSYFRTNTEENNYILQIRSFLEMEITSSILAGENFYFFPSLDEKGSYFYQSTSYIKIKFTNSLSFVFNVDMDYDNKPPPDTKNRDLYYSVNLEWVF